MLNTKLICQILKDVKNSTETRKYSVTELQQIVQLGYAKGRTAKGPGGDVVSIQIIELTPEGQNFLNNNL